VEIQVQPFNAYAPLRLQKETTNPLSVASTGLPELSVGTLLGVSGETKNSRA